MQRVLFPFACALSLLPVIGYGDVMVKFNQGPQSTAAFTFEGAMSLHKTEPYLRNDGNGNDGPSSGAVQISVAPEGAGAAILSSGYTITSSDVGKKLSAAVWYYRAGPANKPADVTLALLLDGIVAGKETSEFAFSSGAAEPGVEPTRNFTGEYAIQAGDVGKKLSLRFRCVKSSPGKVDTSFAIDAVTFLGVSR